MSAEFWAAIIGQTILIIVAIITATIRTERRITRVETKVEHLEVSEVALTKNFTALGSKVGGISRAVARLEGKAQIPRSLDL